jgi:hypothetical protein
VPLGGLLRDLGAFKRHPTIQDLAAATLGMTRWLGDSADAELVRQKPA